MKQEDKHKQCSIFMTLSNFTFEKFSKRPTPGELKPQYLKLQINKNFTHPFLLQPCLIHLLRLLLKTPSTRAASSTTVTKYLWKRTTAISKVLPQLLRFAYGIRGCTFKLVIVKIQNFQFGLLVHGGWYLSCEFVVLDGYPA